MTSPIRVSTLIRHPIVVTPTPFKSRSLFRSRRNKPPTTMCGIQKPGGGQRLDISMDDAVVAPERLCQGGTLLTSWRWTYRSESIRLPVRTRVRACQLSNARSRTRERSRARAARCSCIHEPAQSFIFDRAAYCDFHVVHTPPRKVRTSDQKSDINCSTRLKGYAVSTPWKCR